MLAQNKIFLYIHFQTKFSKTLYYTLEDWYKGYHKVKRHTKAISKLFKHTKAISKMSKYLRAHGKPRIERVLTPSLSIIYTPYSETFLKKGFFCSFSFSFVGWTKSRWRLLLTATFANKKRKPVLTVSSATVSQNWRLYWGINKVGDTLGSRSFLKLISCLFCLLYP